MLSPGTPSAVADAIAQHLDSASAMANAVVNTVMDYQYHAQGESWGPAAAFDVLDLNATKWNTVERDVKSLNDAIGRATPDEAAVIRRDAGTVDGMVRFPDATPDMPWHSDRPAIALYNAIAADAHLAKDIRDAAQQASAAISNTVLGHRERRDFAPFGDASYADAAGPTTHFPVRASQIDPWAPGVSETHNAFYKRVDGDAVARTIA